MKKRRRYLLYFAVELVTETTDLTLNIVKDSKSRRCKKPKTLVIAKNKTAYKTYLFLKIAGNFILYIKYIK